MISDIKINSYALKVERQNATAMTEGFWKDNKHYYVTISTAHKKAKSMQKYFKTIPKILVQKRRKRRPEYLLSSIGKKLNVSNYKDKYVAVLDRIFHIKNNINIWNKLCLNGVFDIWEPKAPFNSLNGKTDQMILLLRIFQIDCDLTNIIERGKYYDKITEQNVKIVRPIIPYNKYDNLYSRNYDGELYFEDIIDKIGNAVSPYLKGKREEIVEYTSKYLESRIFPPPVSEEEFENAVDDLENLESLDTERKAKSRVEQKYLREYLFKENKYAECGICNNEYPVSLLVAAHIKKRSECTLEEKKDKSIVMPMCNFGCDELYENGYISVKEGSVIQIKKEPMTPLIQDYIDKIEGKYCKYWNESTSEYFNWHSEDSKKEGKEL